MEITTMTTEAMPGTRAMAQRLANAYSRFETFIQEQAGCDETTAVRVVDFYLKRKLAKLDIVNGSFHVKHGAFLDIEVIRNIVAEVTR